MVIRAIFTVFRLFFSRFCRFFAILFGFQTLKRLFKPNSFGFFQKNARFDQALLRVWRSLTPKFLPSSAACEIAAAEPWQ